MFSFEEVGWTFKKFPKSDIQRYREDISENRKKKINEVSMIVQAKQKYERQIVNLT